MIGLEVNGKPLMRAYSIASANYEEELEFFSIKVQDGPLTSILQKVQVGDEILFLKNQQVLWYMMTFYLVKTYTFYLLVLVLHHSFNYS
jgi:ferredoxin-NADP reductase